jgi:hypothetical protein
MDEARQVHGAAMATHRDPRARVTAMRVGRCRALDPRVIRAATDILEEAERRWDRTVDLVEADHRWDRMVGRAEAERRWDRTVDHVEVERRWDRTVDLVEADHRWDRTVAHVEVDHRAIVRRGVEERCPARPTTVAVEVVA